MDALYRLTAVLTGLIVLFWIAPSAILAQDAALSFIEGKVMLKKGEKTMVVQKKDLPVALSINDLIRTDVSSTAIVMFPDKSALKLNQQTVVSIAIIEEKLRRMKLSQGSMMVRVTPSVTNSARAFEVETVSVSAGVRGTQFFIGNGSPTGEDEQVWLCVNDGVVNVQRTQTKESVDVKKGEGISISAKGKMPVPQKYEWTQGLNWNMDPENGNVKESINLDSLYGDLLNYDYD